MAHRLVCVVLMLFSTFAVTASDVSRQSVVWSDLLPEPGISGATSGHVPTYHNSMPIGNGQVVSATFITKHYFWHKYSFYLVWMFFDEHNL